MASLLRTERDAFDSVVLTVGGGEGGVVIVPVIVCVCVRRYNDQM